MHFQGVIVHFFSQKTRRRESKVLSLNLNQQNIYIYETIENNVTIINIIN